MQKSMERSASSKWKQTHCFNDVKVYSVSSDPAILKDRKLSSTVQRESKEPRFKCRYVVALIGFGVLAFNGIHNMSLSVSIVAMVNNTALPKQSGNPSETCPDSTVTGNVTTELKTRQGEFDWAPVTQGYIHGSSCIGYMSSLILCGKAAERFGCKWVIFWGIFFSSLSTFLTPYSSWWNVNILIAVQAVRGISQGAIQPAIAIMSSNWFPRFERGSLSSFMQVGQCVGSMVGGLGAGILCDSDLLGGWPAVFYTFGSAGILLSIVIAFILHENPSTHPSISEAEAKFILSNQENELPQRRPDVPWRSLLTSIPMYALCIAFFGMFWLVTHFLVVHPTYLGTIQHFPIYQNGMLSSLPRGLMMMCGLSGSWISSFLNRRNYLGIDKVRKMWNSIACVGYSVGLLGIYLSGCDKAWSIVWTVFAMATEGFVIPGSLIVPADMSPTFSGTISGLASTIGSIASVLCPMLVGFLTNGEQTLEQWNKVIFISIGIAMTTGIIFAIFGSADVQSWNFVQENDAEKPEKEKPEDGCQTIKL